MRGARAEAGRAAGVGRDPRMLSAWLAQSQAWVELEIERGLASAGEMPERLREALRYVLLGGGKRLRPAIVRLSCAHHGGQDGDAALPAVAIEMVHTYSLVHDDLPC